MKKYLIIPTIAIFFALSFTAAFANSDREATHMQRNGQVIGVKAPSVDILNQIEHGLVMVGWSVVEDHISFDTPTMEYVTEKYPPTVIAEIEGMPVIVLKNDLGNNVYGTVMFSNWPARISKFFPGLQPIHRSH